MVDKTIILYQFPDVLEGLIERHLRKKGFKVLHARDILDAAGLFQTFDIAAFVTEDLQALVGLVDDRDKTTVVLYSQRPVAFADFGDRVHFLSTPFSVVTLVHTIMREYEKRHDQSVIIY